MQMRKEATVARDVPAREIPSGTPITLQGGRSDHHHAVARRQLHRHDAGRVPRADRRQGRRRDRRAGRRGRRRRRDEGKTTEQRAWDQLKTCYDPEIPVNIVDLGLVYSCALSPRPEGGEKIDVKFTLTAPGCGMGDVLREDIKGKLLTVPGIQEADVQVVFDPPWSLQMMSDAAKLQLGMMWGEKLSVPGGVRAALPAARRARRATARASRSRSSRGRRASPSPTSRR